MKRKAEITFFGTPAGILSEDDDGYRFTYYRSYLDNPDASAISLTLPLQKDSHFSAVLHPFFDGLIPEGWLLDVVERTWKVNPRDRMGLLMVSCKDCVGAVSVIPAVEEKSE
ncbi:MAG TPA: HipA N-terminal domain-containing protein [Synergistales bacterium]|nr:HipA N-terminal domain-containing protein [Synergistales bacterium]HPK42875.1 HipA N-terminal domain-containing protein [Synergistales bacterium]